MFFRSFVLEIGLTSGKKCIYFPPSDISVSISVSIISPKRCQKASAASFLLSIASGWGGWTGNGVICTDLSRLLWLTPCCFPWLSVPTVSRGSQCTKAKVRESFTWTFSYLFWKQKSCCSASATVLFSFACFSLFCYYFYFLFFVFRWTTNLIYLKSRLFCLSKSVKRRTQS